MTPEERVEKVIAGWLVDDGGRYGTLPGFREEMARAIRDAVAAERERWSRAVGRVELGGFRRGWLAEADKMWAERFESPPPADSNAVLLWATRCREMLRECLALQHNAEFFRKGE